jgi:hypothetical protein
VKLSSIVEAWEAFFFAPLSPISISLFRGIYGLLVIATLLLLRPDWLNWYGPHAWVSLATIEQVEPGPRLNLFRIIPQSDGWIESLFWVFLGSAVLLSIGFLTRLNSVIVFLCLTSIQQRNLFITTRRGHIPARNRLLPDIRAGRSGPFGGSSDPCPVREGRRRSGSPEPLGSAHDSV